MSWQLRCARLLSVLRFSEIHCVSFSKIFSWRIFDFIEWAEAIKTEARARFNWTIVWSA